MPESTTEREKHQRDSHGFKATKNKGREKGCPLLDFERTYMQSLNALIPHKPTWNIIVPSSKHSIRHSAYVSIKKQTHRGPCYTPGTHKHTHRGPCYAPDTHTIAHVIPLKHSIRHIGVHVNPLNTQTNT